MKIMNKLKLIKNRNGGRKKSQKSLVALTTLLLLMVASTRAITLYEYYFNSQHKATISEVIEGNAESYLKTFLINANSEAYYTNKIESFNLQKELEQKNGIPLVYDSLINKKFDPSVYATIKSVYDRFYNGIPNKNNMVVLGTKEGVFYTASSYYTKDVTDMKQSEEILDWETFSNHFTNPDIMREMFSTLGEKKTKKPIIAHISGLYPDNRPYTVEDLVKIYIEEGRSGLDGFMFLNVATITDDGDMFGEIDENFMNKNENVNKIYVYQFTDVSQYMDEEFKSIQMAIGEGKINTERILYENKLDILSSTFTIIIIGIAGICMMVLYRDLESGDDEQNDDNDEAQNR